MSIKGKGTSMGRILLACVIFVISCKTKEKAEIPKEPVQQWSNSLTPVKSEYKRVKISWFEDLYYKRSTSSRDSYEKQDFLAVHRTLPIGTVVELMNPQNGNTVQVKVVYRGPSVSGREFDLSKKAFKKLADPDLGLIYVDCKVMK